MAEILAWDPSSLIAKNQILSEDSRSVTIREESLAEIFCGDCSAQDIAAAKGLLVPQAIAPVLTPISLSEQKFGRVPKIYLETLHDRAIIPELQAKMFKATPCERVMQLNTSHSPFFSAAKELVAYLCAL